ncbi:cytochrome P450 [Pochonia chlamydosporia 170]|uniref:Cytochrome P450 n=1 Tax=Pochonia chlamydosporia 170 TaxID=1380566 RepID=A0A179F560_METCM|nr:cytochrome P450 [Pochonia chlamydosporia 170]OAQ60249.2 cytochrome P450 [Pochonia chlamydosporia 170]
MIVALAAAASLLLILYTLRQAFWSPLSRVPSAHWSARYSSLWILWTRYNGRELSSLVDAHRKHGPILLVGPRDLSVSSYQDGIRRVYDAGFPKPTAFYSVFNYFRRRNAFTSLNRREHGSRRRRTAALYSKTALLQSEHLQQVTSKILHERLVPRLEQAAKKSLPIDGLDLSYCICADYLSAFMFGYCNASQYLLLPRAAMDTWREHYENSMCHETFFVQETPLLYGILKKLSIDLLPKKYACSKLFLEDWVENLSTKADTTIAATKKSDASGQPAVAVQDEPVVYAKAKQMVENDSPQLSSHEKRLEVASEMFDHISASREVLGLVLAYTFWYLAQDPHAQHEILAELTAAGVDVTGVGKKVQRESECQSANNQHRDRLAAQLDSLPYLRAVINESLRMRPTSTPLPRITPPDRAVSVAGIDGIPPNTRINAFQWFMHRDEDKWNRADDWDPERWVLRGVKPKSNMAAGVGQGVLWPFASGPRMCLGNNLTFYMMQHILAVMVSKFTFTSCAVEKDCWPGSPDDVLPIRVQARK